MCMTTYILTASFSGIEVNQFGDYLHNFTTIIDGIVSDVTHAQYYLTNFLRQMNRDTVQSLDRNPSWRSHATVFKAASRQPNVTMMADRPPATAGPRGFSISNAMLIELCDANVIWPPTETCIYDSRAPERLLNGNFEHKDIRHPSQLSHWNISTPGRTDNVLSTTYGASGADVITGGVALAGLRPSISQVVYGLKTSRQYEFSFSMSSASGLAASICRLTATVDNRILYEINGPPATGSRWTRFSTVVTPEAEVQTLSIGIQCIGDTGRVWREYGMMGPEWIVIDEVSLLRSANSIDQWAKHIG